MVIKSQLRKIMKQVDLDNVTSKSIRLQLERDLSKNLEDFKSFIDEEILLILGQMDSASQIFEFHDDNQVCFIQSMRRCA